MKVSVIICTYDGSPYFGKTVNSLYDTFPQNDFELEVIADCEKEKTGLHNTVNRYMALYNRCKGDIIVKSDDDVMYYPKWFDACYYALQSDKTIGYIGPISHMLMKELKIRHAHPDRLPIAPKGQIYWREEEIISGMCWVFKRDLWKKCPYNYIRTLNLDGDFARMVRAQNLKPCSIIGGLISHLSSIPVNNMYRFKGTWSDVPGKPASPEFKRKHSEFSYEIF